jgi:hypothetical protein
MVATQSGATILEETRAGDYYRRSGFNSLTIRDRPSISKGSNRYQITEEDLAVGDIAELIVYPELKLSRSRPFGSPWRFWGEVVKVTEQAFILRLISGIRPGVEADSLVKIPLRYFWDGRVFRSDVQDVRDLR